MALKFNFNPDSIPDMIQAALDTFDFTMPGEAGGTLGKDLVATAALGISQRTREGKDATGADFPANQKDYAEYKKKRYDVDRPAELGGQMASLQATKGKPEVEADAILMVYGEGVPPSRTTALNGVPLKPWELKATDRDKAGHFTEGYGEWYKLDDEIKEAMIAQTHGRFEKHLRDEGLIS